ncbi:unnamed protein product [Porites evermanni]|uniref:Uncharacterized protein n=1 Tax=Porites evermanni TaxID=104178 RepID=A0ABN8M5M0_9CNID|nr:unnamed protein product [Porites evermanni]
MDAMHKLYEKGTTTFDYEKEMERALSTIFRNLRGMEEMRFRVASTRSQSNPDMLSNVCLQSEPNCIESQQNVAEISQEQVEKEQTANSNIQVKSKRRLPNVPQVAKHRVMKSIPCSLGEQDTRDEVYRKMTQDSSSGGVSDNL